ncbi:hypothetical protein CK203_089169 [Vitis vinifera]|uniref:Reverse transcriptase zinc-binding domain-containing protein n=1 Tax=Vitis vinifera TaxID=29760 RepID=A0A438DUR8_VITVI|nr:hypothetical protein CK203_089169 [Vitis vinifera]
MLSQRFPHLFTLAAHRNATIEEMWDQNFGVGGWNLRFIRDFNDWELDMIGNLLHDLRGHRITLEKDSVFWKEGRNGQFRVKEAYSLLDSPLTVVFPNNKIWVERVPIKIVFFAWEAAWGRLWLLIDSRREGGSSPIVVFCVVVKRKM